MEEHRLLPMKENYDIPLFEKLYKETEPLRKKLASRHSINGRIFGVDQSEILSWFDVKFIFVFNKHYDNKNPDILKGFIINALKMYKYRILRSSLTQKNQQYSHTIDVEEIGYLENLISKPISEPEPKDELLELSLAFLRKELSADASFLLDIELDPPLYILDKLQQQGKSPNTKIPSKLIAEYLSLSPTVDNLSYINDLRKEIRECTIKARDYFRKSFE